MARAKENPTRYLNPAGLKLNPDLVATASDTAGIFTGLRSMYFSTLQINVVETRIIFSIIGRIKNLSKSGLILLATLILVAIAIFFMPVFIILVSGSNQQVFGSNQTVLWLFMLFVAIIVYFLPTIMANSRSHNNNKAICILNLFLGWTFLGWVIALVWAFTDNVKETEPTITEKE